LLEAFFIGFGCCSIYSLLWAQSHKRLRSLYDEFSLKEHFAELEYFIFIFRFSKLEL
jgi:hypothetical protein